MPQNTCVEGKYVVFGTRGFTKPTQYSTNIQQDWVRAELGVCNALKRTANSRPCHNDTYMPRFEHRTKSPNAPENVQLYQTVHHNSARRLGIGVVGRGGGRRQAPKKSTERASTKSSGPGEHLGTVTDWVGIGRGSAQIEKPVLAVEAQIQLNVETDNFYTPGGGGPGGTYSTPAPPGREAVKKICKICIEISNNPQKNKASEQVLEHDLNTPPLRKRSSPGNFPMPSVPASLDLPPVKEFLRLHYFWFLRLHFCCKMCTNFAF